MSTEDEKLLKEAKKLPWDERLQHKNWKVRNDANIDLAALCDSITDPKDARLREFGEPHAPLPSPPIHRPLTPPFSARIRATRFIHSTARLSISDFSARFRSDERRCFVLLVSSAVQEGGFGFQRARAGEGARRPASVPASRRCRCIQVRVHLVLARHLLSAVLLVA
jgi:hypothetical protein